MPNLVLNYALRYTRDTGRTNSDLPGFSELSVFGSQFGNSVHQPNLNFAPQFGFAWDPNHSGKTSIRGGAGLFYDTFLLTPRYTDRDLKLPAGLGNVQVTLSGGTLPGTNVDTTALFGQPMGAVATQVVSAQQAFQAATAQQAANFNPNGTRGFLDPNVFDYNTIGLLLDPNYHTPYSIQFNFGVERQLTRSLFVEADYLHDHGLHSVLLHDINLMGSASNYSVSAAQAAVQATLSACGAASVDQATVNCPGFGGRPANITDFAGNGLGSPGNGVPASFVAPGGGYAFPGRNTTFGNLDVIGTIGKSDYNALQLRFRQDLPLDRFGLQHAFWQASYSLSRFNGQSPDQEDSYAASHAYDNVNPMKYFGPSALDRTSMFSFATVLQLKYGLRFSGLTRMFTALPATMTIPLQCSCPAEVFESDITGDGLGGDVLPGTNIGSFGRSVKVQDENKVISAYNSKYGGALTPAGQQLVSSGVMTQAQLTALGATAPVISPAPSNQVGLGGFIADDLRLSWLFAPTHLWKRIPESVVLEPTFDVFNVANVVNYDPPNGNVTSTLRGALDGGPLSINGTTPALHTNRYGIGTGAFSVGIPRALQFGIALTF
jgi:hypothetical protein